ncbi:centrosomal protein of 89 kDa-like [Lytechinus pictus]|uniref:centrosomal protein of 89 kDa-like n=1 Tax=Lytechinus pictus TaxID=7653 RepID=UPI0030BA090D
MARSSMYDYDDSEEEDDEEEDLDYMGISQREREMEYNDDPGYARVEDVQEMLSREKRGTISNRARMETPSISGEEESPRLTDRTGTDTNRSYPVPSPRDPSTLPSTSYAADIHSQGPDESRSQGHSEGRDQRHSSGDHLQDDVDGGGNSGKRKKKKAKEKEKKQKKGKDKPNEIEGLYAQPIKKHEPLERHASILSNESDFTGVSAEDFSDLISPTPSWKRKPQSPDLGNAEVISSRSSKTSKGPRSKNTFNEPMIEKVRVDNNQYAAAPSPLALQDNDIYSHLNRAESLNQSASDDYLRRTNERLETELELIQKERNDLMNTLDQRTKQLVEERGRRSDMNKSLGLVADLEAQVEDLSNTCQHQRDEKRALQEANKRLKGENMNLQDMAQSNQEDDGMYLNQLKKQAEAVIRENEDLKNVIHKLNIQLSRYQAKYAPPQKGDPPGLPSRGSTPRWLTDTKYLSPLITAYEAQLVEKEEEIQANVEEVEELRRSAEEVIRENQRLLRKLEETGGGAGPKARHSESWLNEIEEQARLVLEENQVVLEQMDLQQKKLHDQQRKHAQETIRLTKRLTMVESEKNSVEGELSELQMKYGALKDQHERSVREAESQMPVQEHLDTIAEYKRSMHDMKRQVEAETENTLSRLTTVETEKQSVAMRVADCQAENSQLKGEIQAMQKAQKRLQYKLTMLEKELSHSQSREQAANQHLNRVLEIAEQTAAERDSFKKMAHTQAQEKERAVNKMIAGNVAIGRMEEKLKMYKLRAGNKMDDIMGRMKDQDELHTSRLSQYEREMKHLSQLVREKQDALDEVAADKQKVEEQLEVVWQSATEDNKRLKARLAKSMRSSSAADSSHMPFGSDSDNRGLLSSESD